MKKLIFYSVIAMVLLSLSFSKGQAFQVFPKYSSNATTEELSFGTTVNGKFDGMQELWFHFRANSGEFRLMLTNISEGSDGDLFLYDPSRTEPVAATSNPENAAETISFSSTEFEKTFYICVRNAAGEGSFSLTLAKSSPPKIKPDPLDNLPT